MLRKTIIKKIYFSCTIDERDRNSDLNIRCRHLYKSLHLFLSKSYFRSFQEIHTKIAAQNSALTFSFVSSLHRCHFLRLVFSFIYSYTLASEKKDCVVCASVCHFFPSIFSPSCVVMLSNVTHFSNYY